eukprot:5596537-Pyramimonas_sp.AAC.1
MTGSQIIHLPFDCEVGDVSGRVLHLCQYRLGRDEITTVGDSELRSCGLPAPHQTHLEHGCTIYETR